MIKSPIIASSGGTRDVNNTCNVLHIRRAAQFNASDVLKQIVEAQGLLAQGQTLPANVNDNYKGQSGAAWIGGASSDVLSCSWAKDIDGVVGTIGLKLKPRPGGINYKETILPGDLLVVFMDDAGDYVPAHREAGTLVTYAIVDQVNEGTSVQNMATVAVVNVSARDLAVVLVESQTVFDQAFTTIENAMYTGGFISAMFGEKKQLALSPLENVLLLLLLLFDPTTTKSKTFPGGSAMIELQWKLAPSGMEDTSTTAGLQQLESIPQLISLIDIVTYVQNPLPFYALAKPPNIVQAGNVWSLLESYANTTLNEFFIDVRDHNTQEKKFRDGQSTNAIKMYFPEDPADVLNQQAMVKKVLDSPSFKAGVVVSNSGSPAPDVPNGASAVSLVMRQRPYDHDAFDNLPSTIVDSTEVENLDIARSSHDVLNWFRLKFPDLDVKLQELVSGIRIIPQSIAKFGYRRMDAESIYMFASSQAAISFAHGSANNFSAIFNDYVSLLSEWFSKNEYWYAGQMTMRFRPSIRIGTRLDLHKDGQLYSFYVQSVQHSFVKDPGASRTMLTLTRGRIRGAAIPVALPLDYRHKGFNVAQRATK